MEREKEKRGQKQRGNRVGKESKVKNRKQEKR